MKPERAYLDHILHCIRRIEEDSVSGKERVFASPTLQDAIVRNLQVLCESTQRLTESTKMRHPEVDWRGISGLRNVLVHSSFEIDLETVWSVIQMDLPTLKGASGGRWKIPGRMNSHAFRNEPAAPVGHDADLMPIGKGWPALRGPRWPS